MIPAINYWAVIVATLSTMLVGFVFYARPVFGNIWIKLVGHTEESMQNTSPVVYPTVLIASFFTSWILAGAGYISWTFYGGSFFVNVLLTALILWFGFTVCRMLVHDLFDQTTVKLTALNALHELITIGVVAIIIGVWPPAL